MALAMTPSMAHPTQDDIMDIDIDMDMDAGDVAPIPEDELLEV